MMVGDDFKRERKVEHMSLLGSSGTYIIVHEGQSVWS